MSVEVAAPGYGDGLRMDKALISAKAERVDKPWKTVWAVYHNLPALINPLTTLRRESVRERLVACGTTINKICFFIFQKEDQGILSKKSGILVWTMGSTLVLTELLLKPY